MTVTLTGEEPVNLNSRHVKLLKMIYQGVSFDAEQTTVLTRIADHLEVFGLIIVAGRDKFELTAKGLASMVQVEMLESLTHQF